MKSADTVLLITCLILDIANLVSQLHFVNRKLVCLQLAEIFLCLLIKTRDCSYWYQQEPLGKKVLTYKPFEALLITFYKTKTKLIKTAKQKKVKTTKPLNVWKNMYNQAGIGLSFAFNRVF